MKIIIIPVSYCFTWFKDSASERFRCNWLLPYLPADKYDGTQNLENYDVIIYQKANCEKMVELSRRYKHKIQIFDITDPDWLFEEGKFIKEIISNVNLVTASTYNLVKELKKFGKPTYKILDGHELSFYKEKKIHNDKKPILVWFGYADNFHRIESLIPIIQDKKLELITICEKPVIDFARFVKWKLETVNREIIKGDIVLNLPDIHGFKSDNKTVTGWLLGMPVVERINDLFRFMNYDERVRESEQSYQYAIDNYNVKRSSQELIKIIKEIKK